jgi:hypothetical protein
MFPAMHLPPWILLCAIASPASGQAFVVPASRQPGATDLNSAMPCPLMGTSARLQQFLAAGEIGTASLLLGRVQLRFDGPAPAGPARTHQIQQLSLRVGVTGRAVTELGADFDANLTQPLMPVLDRVAWQFPTDTVSQPGPEAFGGPGSSLSFQLPAPVLLSLPAGGALAIELLVDGNSNQGLDAAFLDFQDDNGTTVLPGVAITNGNGCPARAGAPLARLTTQGLYAPGTAIAFSGDDYPPNGPVVTFLTAHLLAQRLAIPGSTPTCWFYLDLTTGGPFLLSIASATGAIAPGQPGTLLPVPRHPSFCGALLYAQNVAPTAGTPGNPLGIVTSNYRAISIGCTAAPAMQSWFAANPGSASAGIASFTSAGSLAMRLD